MLRVGDRPPQGMRICDDGRSAAVQAVKDKGGSNPSGMLGAWCAWGVVLSGYRQKACGGCSVGLYAVRSSAVRKSPKGACKGPFFSVDFFSPESYASELQNLHNKKLVLQNSFFHLYGKRIAIQRKDRRKPATLFPPSFVVVCIPIPGEAERAKDHPPTPNLPESRGRLQVPSQQSNPVCLMSSTSASRQGSRQAQNRTCTGRSPSSTPATHINPRALCRLGASLWTIPSTQIGVISGQGWSRGLFGAGLPGTLQVPLMSC
ncbi:hypothetical protein QBC45DRAFT_240588 [Copromyces sp. CBS 386.78]|nr:hypothetical protein QBC45DRAFT_240588 [Copromyces sp. CBS 386.78]